MRPRSWGRYGALGKAPSRKVSGGDFEEATPDPFPNSEVKLFGADGTAREAVWESRTLPGFFPGKASSRYDSGLFLFVLCSLSEAGGNS